MKANNDRGSALNGGPTFSSGPGLPAYLAKNWQFRELQAAQTDRWKVEA